MKIKDVGMRALKTFVQAGLACLVPQLVAMLNNYMEFDWGKWTTYLPLITAALAAGISAAWNSIINATGGKEIDIKK